MDAWEVRDGLLELNDVEHPRRRPGEELITVTHAGLCGSDIPKLIDPGSFALPNCWRPGHEIVGVGPAGGPVAVDPLVPCGACRRCEAGEVHLCPDLRRIGWDLPGGLARQVVAPAGNVHPLPAELDPITAVLADPATVAVHGLRCNLATAPGRLAVIGAGTVGLLTALHASDTGWDVTVVHREGRVPKPTMTGIAAVHSPSSVRPRTFDVVVDAATGQDATPLELGIHLVRDGGTVVVQNAYYPNIITSTPLRDIFRRSVQLIGSFSHCRRRPSTDFTIALTLLRQHHAQVQQMVTGAGSLVDLRTVLTRPHEGRQVLTTR